METKQYSIEVDDISKIYHLYANAKDRFKEIINPRNKSYHKDFYALNHVSFKIEKGHAVGIIGTNGAGKSTLLKIITDVLSPTSGQVITRGKVAALLELGAGFNPEYTGIENIYLNGTLMGYTKEEMAQRVNAIKEFADIGEYINQPVKTYSSGMFARLAFAVSVNVEPDILIVDEALSVGDIRFQQKSFRKMQEMRQEKTVLLVTHDMGAVIKFCDQAMWIEHGELQMFGTPKDVVKEYQSYLASLRIQGAELLHNDATSEKNDWKWKLEPIDKSVGFYGSLDAEIEGCGLYRKGETEPVHVLSGGIEVEFVMKVKKNKVIAQPIAGLTVNDRMGTNLFSVNSFISEDDIYTTDEVNVYICRFTMPELNEGEYTISPAFADGTQSSHTMLHWLFDAYAFQIIVPFIQPLNGTLAITEFQYSVM